MPPTAPIRIALALALAAVSAACTEPVRVRACTPIRPPETSEVGSTESGDAGNAAQQRAPDAGPEGTQLPDASTAPSVEPVRTPSNDHTADVNIEMHPRVRTILVVTWTQTLAADETWLEFDIGNGDVMRSPPKEGRLGAHREVVLGAPGETEVSVSIVASIGGTEYASTELRATTGAVPAGMPQPEIFSYDASRASPKRWLFGSVEDSVGGHYSDYYLSTFWLYIMDRWGRIVWYYADPTSNATSSFQRVARDGEYIWLEKRAFSGGGEQSVVKMTLDREYFEEILVPGLNDAIDVTDDGSVLYDRRGELRELRKNGDDRAIWSCRSYFGPSFHCYTNTVNWYAPEDSVLLSFPYRNTVVEVARQSGRVIAQYGNSRDSYAFAPPTHSPPDAWAFSFQHFPTRTAEGTLLVSTHVPNCNREAVPGPYRHAFVEFEIDRDARELLEIWHYTGGREWPRAKGMAIRLENGNTLANYGTGGVIREITPRGHTVFGVKFDAPEGDDFYNKMVGHNVLLDDLYALNGGPD